MRQGHPLAQAASVSLADLAGHDLVVTHPRSLIRQQMDQMFRDAGLKPVVRLETSSGAIACQLAAMGLGIAVADPFVALSSGATSYVMRRFRAGHRPALRPAVPGVAAPVQHRGGLCRPGGGGRAPAGGGTPSSAGAGRGRMRPQIGRSVVLLTSSITEKVCVADAGHVDEALAEETPVTRHVRTRTLSR